jgi:uncharacterized NAD(P)/FAD-binding protein YdhS
MYLNAMMNNFKYSTDKPFQIAIIGGGFCGLLTTVRLLQLFQNSIHIHLINKGCKLAKGIAYEPHSPDLLLNVPNKKMSAFPEDPDHFLTWLNKHPLYQQNCKSDLGMCFSSRKIYGEYLTCIWENAIQAKHDQATVSLYDEYADDIIEDEDLLKIYLRGHKYLTVDAAVLAVGNMPPIFPRHLPLSFIKSGKYFNDPWKDECIKQLNPETNVLVVGNGLTMVDTVIGLFNENFSGTVHSISPHGYRLQPWKELKEAYTGIDVAGISVPIRLLDLLKLLNKHRKKADLLNQSFYPVIDALRPMTQAIWKSFTKKEKRQFLKYLNSFWNSARHRLPISIYKYVEGLRNNKRLITHTGYILNAVESNDNITVTIFSGGKVKYLKVQRIVNCTGPGTNIKHTENILLKNIEKRGLICRGHIGLGILVNPKNNNVIKKTKSDSKNIFAIGGLLKGSLWETTAVPELGTQAYLLAKYLASTKMCRHI